MKTMTILLLMATTQIFSQEFYDQFRMLRCEHSNGVSIINFRNAEYDIDTCKVYLNTYDEHQEFKSDLEFCINYIVEGKKDKAKLVHTNDNYTLVIHDLPNRIYLYDKERNYTSMTIKEAKRLLEFINQI